MQNVYLKDYSLPEKFTRSTCISVSQIDPITNNELVLHKSITDVLLKFQMSRTTLKKCSNNNGMNYILGKKSSIYSSFGCFKDSWHVDISLNLLA